MKRRIFRITRRWCEQGEHGTLNRLTVWRILARRPEDVRAVCQWTGASDGEYEIVEERRAA